MSDASMPHNALTAQTVLEWWRERRDYLCPPPPPKLRLVHSASKPSDTQDDPQVQPTLRRPSANELRG